MPRGNIRLILIVTASMLSAEADVGGVEIPARPTPSRNEIRRSQLKNEIENLQAQLAKKTQEFEAQKQALDKLHQQQSVLSRTATNRSEIQTRDLAIQSLISDLGDYHQAEEDINQKAATVLKNQDSQAALARAEVDASVDALEKDIRDTENDLNYWKSVPVGPQVLDQPAQVERLQNQLNQQRVRLDDLRVQRVGISASVLSNTQTIQSLAEQAKAELRDSATNTQGQIYSLRSDIDRLQRTQAASEARLQGITLQISKAEKDLEERTIEVRRLQESLQTIQAKQNEIQAQ